MLVRELERLTCAGYGFNPTCGIHGRPLHQLAANGGWLAGILSRNAVHDHFKIVGENPRS